MPSESYPMDLAAQCDLADTEVRPPGGQTVPHGLTDDLSGRLTGQLPTAILSCNPERRYT